VDLSGRLLVVLALLLVAPRVAASNCPSEAACIDARRADIVAQRLRDDDSGSDTLRVGETLYEHLRLSRHFEFRPGDVLLVRSDELVSAAISQIAVTPAFFSHVAIVALDPQWKTLEVVEAGVDEGLRATSLDDWLDRSVVRFAVYRHRQTHIAERAAVAAFEDLAARRADARGYDLRLDLDDATQLYCSEVITRAFATAAPDAQQVPQQLSDVGNLIDTFPLAALGIGKPGVFMPDDLETDARFERILERRAPDAIERSAALDASLRAVFDALRGADRDTLLAELDATAQSPLRSLPALLRGSFTTWRRLPEPARSRLAALAHKVEGDAQRRLASAR
jgi:hypothetical protein